MSTTTTADLARSISTASGLALIFTSNYLAPIDALPFFVMLPDLRQNRQEELPGLAPPPQRVSLRSLLASATSVAARLEMSVFQTPLKRM